MYAKCSLQIFVLLVFCFISVRSIYFFNVWHSCLDVAVETNVFPVSLIQTSKYYQVCPGGKEHWQRFGSTEFRMHIIRTTEPLVDKYVYLQHNGYIHFHNETKQTIAKWYGAEHEDL